MKQAGGCMMAKLQDNIRAYRKKNGLSQSDFASKLHVTKQAVSKWETGRGYPDSALIPEIAKVMGVSIDSLMGENRRNKKVVFLISSLLVIIILTIVFTPMVNKEILEVSEFNELKGTVESSTTIDLPDKGTAVIADFQDWIQYGNALVISQMSYLVFDEGTQTEEFESGLLQSDKWIAELSDEQIAALPYNITTYSTTGDFYSLYNLDSKSYNELPSLPGTYEYMFLIYQLDHNRLIVFDFSVVVEEGE